MRIKKLEVLLTKRQKLVGFWLLILMLVGMFLEAFGVSLLVPVLAFMSQDDPVGKYPEMREFLLSMHIYSNAQLVIITMITLVIFYGFKTGFLLVMNWQQSKFIFDVQTTLSQRLFASYLAQPYTFHLQHNSSHLIHTIATETGQFCRGAMLPAMMLLTEGLVLAGICILLMIFEPIGALVIMAIMLFSGILFYKSFKGRSVRWGAARQFHEAKSIQHLQQGLGGVKEVKLLGLEAFFLSQFTQHSRQSADMWKKQVALQAFPRLWLELLSITVLAVLVVILLYKGHSTSDLITTLGLFAAAAFRLMPSFNRILTSAQNLRFSLPVIDRLTRELQMSANINSQVDSKKDWLSESDISLKGVSFFYPGSEHPSLREVTLNIPRCGSLGIVGSSGAGKSTLVDMILGLLVPSSGKVMLGGVDIQTNLRAWMSQIGYVPQNVYLTDDTLRNNIAFGLPAEAIDDTAIRRALRAAQLDEFVSGLPDKLDTIIGERGVKLSGGQRQRIGIARSLYHDPSILVLDEATSALDTETEQEVMSAVGALHGKKTIIIIAHRLSTLSYCDTIVHIENGEIINMRDGLDISLTISDKG